MTRETRGRREPPAGLAWAVGLGVMASLLAAGPTPVRSAGRGRAATTRRAAAGSTAPSSRPKKPRTVSERFGFVGPEVYKAHGEAALVRVGDFDGDGLNDVLFVDNGTNKLVLYLQRAEGRLEKQERDIERYIRDLAVGDFNGDRRTDLAYLGDPENLVVALQEKGGRFGPEREFRTKGKLVAAGDLDGDRRDDLVVVGKEALVVLFQQRPGGFTRRVKMALEESAIERLVLADVDGDGRLDICTTARNGSQVTYRCQRPGGHFAPAVTQQLKAMHGATFGRVGRFPADRLFAFHDRTNALKMLALRPEAASRRQADEEPFRLSSARFMSYGPGRAVRVVTAGDITGDGRDDLVVADGGTAQLAVYRQEPTGALARKVLYPTLSAVTQAAIDSATGEIFLVSPAERILGVVRQEKSGRVCFPRPLPVKDKPTALALADLDGRAGLDLVYAAQDEEKRKSRLGFFYRRPDGSLKGPVGLIPFEEEDLVVSRLVPVDLDANGLCDLIVFFEYQKPRILLQEERGRFVDATGRIGFRKGLTGSVRPENLSVGDVDGDGRSELLVCAKNFARSLGLRDGTLAVIDQYNGKSGESTVVRAAAIDLDGDRRREIVLFDSHAQVLSILAQGADRAYTIVQEVEVGPMNLRGLLTADLNGDRKPDLVLAGAGKFAIVYSGLKDRRFSVLAQYKTLIKDGHYTSLTTGDLDADGAREVLVVDGAEHHLEILSAATRPGRSAELRQELTFRVYEPGPRVTLPRWGQQGRQWEPRRVIVADLNNDGKDDILVLIHDNLVIYRQE